MPFCPTCRSEYRTGFTRCEGCQQDLVAVLGPAQAEAGSADAVEAAIDGGTAMIVARAGYAAACEMRDALAVDRVPAVVLGDPSSCDDGGACTRYDVFIHPDSADAARGSLVRGFQAMLVNEGVDPAAADSVVDPDSEGEVTCPACDTAFMAVASEDLECPECGLFLGVPTA